MPGELFLCGLTFEVSGSRRCGAWPAGRMMKHSGPRAKRHAVGSPLDRGVRHRLSGPVTVQAACVPPETQTYGCRKRLLECHVVSRSAAGAVACNGARGRAQGREALRGSAVPARSEGISISSALTPPDINPAKLIGGSKRRTTPKSMARTSDLNGVQMHAGCGAKHGRIRCAGEPALLPSGA